MRSWMLPALILVAACVRPSKVIGVSCDTAADCAVASVSGTCESTGFCSYPDVTCVGGQRYSPGAGDNLSNTCVGGDVACGAQDQTCCNGTVCSSDLQCDEASRLCVCGGEGQVCCASATCAANLACGAGETCECGAIDEPCCGGTTCDTGVSCVAGTCTAGVTNVGLGMGHACAVRTDKSVWCWGADWKPYPVNAPSLFTQYIGSVQPRRVAGVDDVVALGSAEFSVCARKTDGTVWCWGHGESGQLGDGSLVGRRDAKQVPGLTNVTMIEGGRMHACAVGSYNGAAGVWCWGRGALRGRGTSTVDPDLGRLGNNNNVDSAVPVAVDLSVAASAGQTVRALSVGSYHSCIALSDNTVWCWGRNEDGQLGNGTTVHTKVPVPVTMTNVTIPAGVAITAVTCGDGTSYFDSSSCLLLSNGAMYCWGTGRNGILGDGTITARTTPTTAVDITALAGDPVVELASGMQAHCGRTQGGNVWCWGNSKNGVMGSGATTDVAVSTPSRVIELSGATHIELSHRTACAVDGNQRMFCWGNNVRNPMLNPAVRVYEPVEVKP